MPERPDLPRRAAAEGLAAFALVFAGCGAIVSSGSRSVAPSPPRTVVADGTAGASASVAVSAAAWRAPGPGCEAWSSRALASGVSGFLPKSRGADEVAEVIRRVAAGGRYVDPEVAADALSDERCPLTDRELDVLRAGRRGETTGQIARSLSLAPGTVRNHVSAILSKLAVSTRQQAVLFAEERGWI